MREKQRHVVGYVHIKEHITFLTPYGYTLFTKTVDECHQVWPFQAQYRKGANLNAKKIFLESFTYPNYNSDESSRNLLPNTSEWPTFPPVTYQAGDKVPDMSLSLHYAYGFQGDIAHKFLPVRHAKLRLLSRWVQILEKTLGEGLDIYVNACRSCPRQSELWRQRVIDAGTPWLKRITPSRRAKIHASNQKGAKGPRSK